MDRRENEGEGKGRGGGTPLGPPKSTIQKWWVWRRDSWLLHKICEVYFLYPHFKAFNRDITVKIIYPCSLIHLSFSSLLPNNKSR